MNLITKVEIVTSDDLSMLEKGINQRLEDLQRKYENGIDRFSANEVFNVKDIKIQSFPVCDEIVRKIDYPSHNKDHSSYNKWVAMIIYTYAKKGD